MSMIKCGGVAKELDFKLMASRSLISLQIAPLRRRLISTSRCRVEQAIKISNTAVRKGEAGPALSAGGHKTGFQDFRS